MSITMKRPIALLLVLLMVFGLVGFASPTKAFAAESETTIPVETTEATEPVIEVPPTEEVTADETTAPTEERSANPSFSQAETAPTESTAPNVTEEPTPTEEPSTEETTPPEESEPVEVLQTIVGTAAPDEYAVMPLVDTYGKLWDHVPLMVTMHSEIKLTFQFPSGKVGYTNIKNLAWHYVDDPSNLLYCIEPNKTYGMGSGFGGDEDVGLDGSGSSNGANAWYQYSQEKREAIALILLYGCPNKLWDVSAGTGGDEWSNPNAGARAATQVLIWEIVADLRDPVTFVLNSSNG